MRVRLYIHWELREWPPARWWTLPISGAGVMDFRHAWAARLFIRILLRGIQNGVNRWR